MKEIEAEWGDFFKRHPYSEEKLNSLPTESFNKKWRMILKWQDDTKITGGTKVEISGHRNSFVDSLRILSRLPPAQYPKVLNTGCGGGGETEVLRELGYQPTGYTLGPLNLIWAKETYGLDVIYGDMHDMPFPEGSFDAVVSKESFEHCFAPILVTIEVCHVLRDYGRWLISQPSHNNEVGFNWGHPTILSAKQRKALFESFGFRVLENTEIFSLCMKLPDEELKDAPLSIRKMRRKMR